MILYFTSTGNCAYVARRIADATGDVIAPIDRHEAVSLASGEMLGFVFPTYFWALPHYVEQYMRRMTITSEDAEPYIFFVATYGTTCGSTGKIMAAHLDSKGYALTSAHSIKMPDNWTPWFDLSDREKVAATNAAAEPLIDEVIAAVMTHHRGNVMRETKPSWMNFFSLKMYESYRRTKHFHVEDGCISCGKCERECPEHAIALREGAPVWVKEKCTLCLHCVHSCPAFTIQYGKNTKKHGQYHHDL